MFNGGQGQSDDQAGFLQKKREKLISYYSAKQTTRSEKSLFIEFGLPSSSEFLHYVQSLSSFFPSPVEITTYTLAYEILKFNHTKRNFQDTQ